MSDRWFQPLVSALGSTPPPTDPPPGTGACAVEIRVVNSWQGGFQADIVVRNNGTAAMNGWTVRFGLAAGMSVQQAWNGVVSTTGLNVSVGNVGWNGSLAPASSATVGMIINGDPAGWNPNPVC